MGGSTPASRFLMMPVPVLDSPSPYMLDIMAAFSSGQIPSIPRDRLYADVDPRKHWTGPNRRY